MALDRQRDLYFSIRFYESVAVNTLISFFEKLKLNTKLVLGLGSMLVIIVGIGLQAIYSARQQSNEIRRMYELELQGVSHIKEASIHLMQMGRSLRQMVLSPDPKSRAVARADLYEARSILHRSLQDSDKLFFRPEGRALLADIGDVLNQYLRNVDHVTDLLARDGTLQNTEITRFLASPENVRVFDAIDKLMDTLVRHKESVAKRAAQDAIESSNQIERWTLMLLLLGSVAGLLSGVLLGSSLRRPSERLRLSVEKLAQGELQTPVPHTDFQNEIGAMARSVSVLQQGANRADVLRWSKTQANLIGAKVQAIERLGEFADTLLAQLTPLLQAQMGLLYVWDGALGKYRCQGGSGLTLEGSLLPDFAPGEGLLGQCARDAKPMQIDAVGASSLRIRSGLIEDRPHWVYLLPVRHVTGDVLAVLELASFAPLGEREQTLLQEVLLLVALNLKIIERNQTTHTLFLQTEQQSIELREQNVAIEQARQRAEEATRAKSEFLANMSHEIRTPMNAVIGLSYLALKTDLSAQQRDYVQKIHSEGSTLLGILNDILDFSKIEADKMTLEVAPFWLDDVLDSVSTLVAHKAQEKGIEFLIRVLPEVPQNLLGDALRFKQILTNLLHNAIKFTDQGQVEVTIALTQRRAQRLELTITVKDSGIGMSAAQCQALFGAFSQADSSTTRRFGGTGLGLAISKRFVELMQGQIGVTSEPGVSSTFTYSVWLQRSDQQSRAQLRDGSTQGMRVLVVDDNPAARQILAEQLTGLGLRADEAVSGQSGLAALHQADASDPYQVVLMDWQMPGMDGVETTRRITHDSSLLHRPSVVMVTAFGADEARGAGSSAGASAFLDKPVSQSRLWDALVCILRPQVHSTQAAVSTLDHRGALPGVRVLLVEDNEINQQIARELLQAMGVQVTLADNGQQALDLLQAAPDPLPWSLVLMDLQMPVMDGHQVTRLLRSQQRFAMLPIVALTAHASAEEGSRCLSEGMNAHLTKPIEPSALYRAVAYWSKAASADHSLQIEGINVAQGLHYCAGNNVLFESLLRRFLASSADTGRELRQAIELEDFASAERTSHSLKGVGANLGAAHCSHLSGELEQALRQRAPVATLAPLQAALEQHLAVLLAAIAHALPAKESAAAPALAALDRVLLGRVCWQLADLLASSNVQASSLAQEHAALLHLGFGEGADLLQAQIGGFDYATALAQLRQLSAALQIELPAGS